MWLKNTNDRCGERLQVSKFQCRKPTAPRTALNCSTRLQHTLLHDAGVMPCLAQTHRNLQASHLAAKSRLSAKLPVPVGKSYRRSLCRSTRSQLGAVEKAQAKPRPEYVPGRIEDASYVRIFDTTLRDGEQSPGLPAAYCRILLVPLYLLCAVTWLCL